MLLKSLKKVLDVIIGKMDVVVHIETDENDIATTQKHPFYVGGKVWIVVSELVKGRNYQRENLITNTRYF